MWHNEKHDRMQLGSSADLKSFDLRDPGLIADPQPTYTRLRALGPVHYLPRHDLWMVTRYQEAVKVLRAPAVFSSKLGMSFDLARPGTVNAGIDYRFGGPDVRVLVATDPPEHQVFRHAVAGMFSRASVEAVSERIARRARSCVQDLLEQGTRGTADFYEHVAAPLPVLVLADLFGIPEDMHSNFRAWATLMTADLDNEPCSTEIGRGLDMFRYFSKQLRHPPQFGRPTVFDSIMSARGAGVSERELLAFCAFLLVAGVETTTNLLTNLLAALIAFPDAFRQLRASPELLPAAIEEGLRYETPLQVLWRGTTQPAELGPHRLPAGARVMVAFGSANRDEREFITPDVFRLDRDPNAHLGFGSGPHFCLGARLARLEVTSVMRALLAATTNIEIAGQPIRTNSIVLRGFTKLPLRVRPT
jgi:cytochrome P450